MVVPCKVGCKVDLAERPQSESLYSVRLPAPALTTFPACSSFARSRVAILRSFGSGSPAAFRSLLCCTYTSPADTPISLGSSPVASAVLPAQVCKALSAPAILSAGVSVGVKVASSVSSAAATAPRTRFLRALSASSASHAFPLSVSSESR